MRVRVGHSKRDSSLTTSYVQGDSLNCCQNPSKGALLLAVSFLQLRGLLLYVVTTIRCKNPMVHSYTGSRLTRRGPLLQAAETVPEATAPAATARITTAGLGISTHHAREAYLDRAQNSILYFNTKGPKAIVVGTLEVQVLVAGARALAVSSGCSQAPEINVETIQENNGKHYGTLSTLPARCKSRATMQDLWNDVAKLGPLRGGNHEPPCRVSNSVLGGPVLAASQARSVGRGGHKMPSFYQSPSPDPPTPHRKPLTPEPTVPEASPSTLFSDFALDTKEG